MTAPGTIPPAEGLVLAELITPTPHGIASRVLARAGGGTVTLFAFDGGDGLSEHSTPYDALALVLEGPLTLTIGGVAVTATAGTIVRLSANVPHAVEAPGPARTVLVMLKDLKP